MNPLIYLDLPGSLPDLKIGLDGLSFVIGAALGLLGARSRVRPIARRPYFALWAALLLATTLPEASARLVADTGRQDAIFLRWMDVALSLFEGAALIGLGMGRSLDAFGRRRWGALVTIPILNILLFLAPRRVIGPPEPERLPRILTGRMALPVGILAIFIAGMAHALVQGRVDPQGVPGIFRAEASATETRVLDAATVEKLISRGGRASAERAMAFSWSTPRRVDDRTQLVDVASRSYGLRMIYVVEGEMDLIPWGTRVALMRHSCLYPPFELLIAEGSTIRHDYRHPDGTRIGMVTVDADICG